MKRLIHIKDNQLTICTQAISGDTPVHSFLPLFSVIKNGENEIKLELTSMAADYYKIPEGLDLDKAKYLINSLTRSPKDKVTNMHQVLDLFVSGNGMSKGTFMFERDGSYSVSEQATKFPTPTVK